jgi:hypothetical protein
MIEPSGSWTPFDSSTSKSASRCCMETSVPGRRPPTPGFARGGVTVGTWMVDGDHGGVRAPAGVIAPAEEVRARAVSVAVAAPVTGILDNGEAGMAGRLLGVGMVGLPVGLLAAVVQCAQCRPVPPPVGTTVVPGTEVVVAGTQAVGAVVVEEATRGTPQRARSCCVLWFPWYARVCM